MKKTALYLSILTATVFGANAQTAESTQETTATPTAAIVDMPTALQKGNFMIGTRLGLSSTNTNVKVSSGAMNTGGSSAFQMSVTPTIGYFFTDNFAVGFGMDYVTSSVTDKTNNKETNVDSKTLFGPFARYYLPIDDSEAFFFGVVSGFGRSQNDLTVNNTKQSITNQITSFGFGPGYTIISKRNLAMEAQLKYNIGNSKSTVNLNGVTSTTTSASNGFDFVVGVTYYFGRSK